MSLYLSGNQTGAHDPDAQSVLLKIPVAHFPIVIQKDRAGGHPFWPESDADWERTLSQLQELAQSGAHATFRLRLPTPVFTETGDLLLLKCHGIAPILEPSHNRPQADAAQR